MDALNIKWIKIPSGEKSKDGYTLEMVKVAFSKEIKN